MADKFFQWKAPSRAQVSTIQITAYDATTTYTLSVNGVPLATSLAAGSATAAATALAAAWEASNQLYASVITATSTTDTLTFTADVPEVRFTVLGSTAGGAGTIGAFTAVTTGSGPHTLTDPINWSGEALPANDDVIIFRKSARPVLWDLAGLATTGHALEIEQSFTAAIGLEPSEFLVNGDGAGAASTAPEYRPLYLSLDCAAIDIGRHDGPKNPGGSRRLMIDNPRLSGSQTIVHNTGAGGQSTGRPAAMLKYAHTDAHIDVRGGNVGIGVVVPGEAVTMGDAYLTRGELTIGSKVDLDLFSQLDGVGYVDLRTAALASLICKDGLCVVTGNQAITAAEVRGGEVRLSSSGIVTKVDQYGGLVDYTRGSIARTVTAHEIHAGGGAQVKWDKAIVNLTLTVDTALHSATFR